MGDDSLPWRVLFGHEPLAGLFLVALGILTGYALGVPPPWVATAGAVGTVIVTGFAFTRYFWMLACLAAFLWWAGLLPPG